MIPSAQYSGVDPATGKGRTLHIENGIIQSEDTCAEQGLPLLSPGLVDQVNGYCRHDLNSGVLEARVRDIIFDGASVLQ